MRVPPAVAACVVLAFSACASAQQHAPAPQASSAGAQTAAASSASPSPSPSAAGSTATPTLAPTPLAARPTPTPSPSATAPPVVTTAAPSPAATSTPFPARTKTATSIPEMAPNAPPEIVSLKLDKTVVSAGETVSGIVRTSSNVASVEARIADYSIDVPKIAPGEFAMSYPVPKIPFFLKKTYQMTVIARNTAGDETSTTIPITIR